jgi:hypothetical protein
MTHWALVGTRSGYGPIDGLLQQLSEGSAGLAARSKWSGFRLIPFRRRTRHGASLVTRHRYDIGQCHRAQPIRGSPGDASLRIGGTVRSALHSFHRWARHRVGATLRWPGPRAVSSSQGHSVFLRAFERVPSELELVDARYCFQDSFSLPSLFAPRMRLALAMGFSGRVYSHWLIPGTCRAGEQSRRVR